MLIQKTFYIQKLEEGISTLAAAFAPKPVIVRMSDFKSNEYANMLGGDMFETRRRKSDDRISGVRAVIYHLSFRECFELECQALKHVRDEMGLNQCLVDGTHLFETLDEADQVIELLAEKRF